MTDADLLHRYARERDQAAFAELVRRHADLVYSAARRQIDGDHHRAQEVTQMVFLGLARKAASLARHPCLPGWLYQTTRYTSARHRQSDTRRAARETTAAADPTLPFNTSAADAATSEPPADWSRVEPLLDDALAALGEADRQAILLRYFTGHAYADIGQKLGLAENSARMRTERALEKLRRALAKRGVTSTTSALGLALGANAVTAAPASVVSSTLAALATPAALATATAVGAFSTILTMSLLKHAATGLVCATLASLAVHHFTATPEPVPAPASRALPASVAAPPPTFLAPAAPDPRLAELAAENAALRARLAATETDRDSTRNKLAELRRPMTADLVSSTLRATVQPGETIVTGGSLMPDGKRLFAFATPTHSSHQGQATIDVDTRFLALPDSATTLLGLDKLATSAANTLQHGEIWAPGESDSSLANLDQTSGADTLNLPRVRLLPGREGSVNFGKDGGEMLQLKILPKLTPDGRAFDMEVRLELDPRATAPADAIP